MTEGRKYKEGTRETRLSHFNPGWDPFQKDPVILDGLQWNELYNPAIFFSDFDRCKDR